MNDHRSSAAENREKLSAESSMITTLTHPISEKKLDVAALLEGTTPGPWEMTTHGTGLGFGVMQAFDVGFMQVSSNHTEADAALIAAAPRLAVEHIALTKKVDELEAENAALRSYAREASRELTHHSGGGSEMFDKIAGDFFANPKRCRERIWHRNEAMRKIYEIRLSRLNDTTQCRESKA